MFEYVDFHLQPIVKQIHSCVKDTTDVLGKLDTIKSVPDNAYLVSLDVKFFYTSVPNGNRIKTLKESFNKYIISNVATKVVTTFLALKINSNIFGP